MYLSEHLGQVIHIGGAKALSLKAFGLQQVFGDVRSVDEHAMERPLLISICLEHDLE